MYLGLDTDSEEDTQGLSVTMNYDPSLHEEVLSLRKKVVALETAEADNVKLRKEFSKLKVSSQEERSQLEMDFMNQLTGVARENALHIEELEGKIGETTKVNKILHEQLQQAPTHQQVEERLESMEALHRKELAQIIDANKLELEKTRHHLSHVLTSRDNIQEELETCKKALTKAQTESVSSSTSSSSMQAMLAQAQEENDQLKGHVKTLLETSRQLANDKKALASNQSEVQILQERLKARDTELATKAKELERLESKVATAAAAESSAETLQTENTRLKTNIQRLETEKRQQRESMDRLEEESKELRDKCETLESDLQRARTTVPVKSPGPKTPTGTPGRKTSKIVHQWEQNLKEKEPLSVQTGAQEEIVELREKLESERSLTLKLRGEIQQLTAVTVKATTTPKSPSKTVSKIPTFSGRKSTAAITSPTSTTATPTALATPRTPVRGLVHSFEKKISQNTNSQMADIASYRSIDDLKDALQFERQQVFELEDELTRQCEINCALLKEIAAVANETETSRSKHATAFESHEVDVQKITSLTAQVQRLQTELEQTKESKLTLTAEFERLEKEDKAEIARRSKQVAALQRQLDEAERTRSSLAHLEKSSSSDKQELDRLRFEISQLKHQLDGVMRDLDHKVAELLSMRKKNDSLEQDQLNQRREIDSHQSQVNKLTSEHRADQDKIQGLNSLVATLQSNLADSDATKEALQQEKLAASRLDSLVQDLKKDLQQSEEKVQTLESKQAQIHEQDDVKLTSLSNQVDSLKTELQTVTAQLRTVEEERDDYVDRDSIHNNKFDSLRSEINDKVSQFQDIHKSDKEEIQRLHEQVEALEEELRETLTKVERLQKELQDKEQVEETVEELQRKNQNSLDSQINKLTRELTQARLTEVELRKKFKSSEDKIESLQTKHEGSLHKNEKSLEEIQRTVADKETVIARLAKEKEQLVLSMKDMTSSRRDEIDELQTELMTMSTRAADQAREVQTLKIKLDESSYRKEEVERLRTRVRELSERLASQSPSRIEGDSDRELVRENDELRQKLREMSISLKATEDKMRAMVVEKGGSSKSMQVLRERNATLKFEVEKLTRKLKKLVGERKKEVALSKASKDRYLYMDTKSKKDKSSTRFMI